MDNVLAISTAVFCFLLFLFVRRSLRERRIYFRKIILKYKYFLHPNAITIGGALLSVVAILLYHFHFPRFAIVIFILAAAADAFDGMVARLTGLVTEIGKEIDPLCDKVRYLIPLIYFANEGLVLGILVFALCVVDFFGQFLRRLVDFVNQRFHLHIAIAANHFGKVKTVCALFLVVYCFLRSQKSGVPDLANEILLLVFVLAILSVVFKFSKKQIPVKKTI